MNNKREIEFLKAKEERDYRAVRLAWAMQSLKKIGMVKIPKILKEEWDRFTEAEEIVDSIRNTRED